MVNIMGISWDITWLFVWNIFFPYIGNFIIPTDELIFFRGVGIPPASNSCLSWEHQLKLNYGDDDDMVWSENEGFTSYGHGNDD